MGKTGDGGNNPRKRKVSEEENTPNKSAKTINAVENKISPLKTSAIVNKSPVKSQVKSTDKTKEKQLVQETANKDENLEDQSVEKIEEGEKEKGEKRKKDKREIKPKKKSKVQKEEEDLPEPVENGQTS